jgi:hypothetical protein
MFSHISNSRLIYLCHIIHLKGIDKIKTRKLIIYYIMCVYYKYEFKNY